MSDSLGYLVIMDVKSGWSSSIHRLCSLLVFSIISNISSLFPGIGLLSRMIQTSSLDSCYSSVEILIKLNVTENESKYQQL